MRDLASTVQAWNGELVGDEWMLAVGWQTSSQKAQTMVFGIDIKTGKRRHVSGAFNDPALGYTEVGSGLTFVNLMDINLGKDGKLYAASDTKLLEVDLATGNRKLISNAKDPGGLGGGPIKAEGLGDG